VLHIYTLCLEAIVVTAELEWPAFFRWIPFLETWAMRGIFQIFVGVLVQTGSILDEANDMAARRLEGVGNAQGVELKGAAAGSGGGSNQAESFLSGLGNEDVWFFVASWYLIATGTVYFLLVSQSKASSKSRLASLHY
jgi:hypothetical protein